MSEQPSTTPATERGTTTTAGEGVGDEEFSKTVAEQTSSDLKAEDVFERETDGAVNDKEAAKETGDDLAQ